YRTGHAHRRGRAVRCAAYVAARFSGGVCAVGEFARVVSSASWYIHPALALVDEWRGAGDGRVLHGAVFAGQPVRGHWYFVSRHRTAALGSAVIAHLHLADARASAEAARRARPSRAA